MTVCPPAIKQALLDLELVSHAPIATLGRTSRSTSTSIGGNKPSGGNRERLDHDLTTDERLSFESSYLSKTVEHYTRQLEGRFDRRTGIRRPGILNDDRLDDEQRATKLDELLADIQDTIRCWRFTPAPVGIDPERGTFYWKCMVADDDRGTVKDIARRHDVHRNTVHNYRRRYRGLLGLRGANG